jgi:hypothetical protein
VRDQLFDGPEPVLGGESGVSEIGLGAAAHLASDLSHQDVCCAAQRCKVLTESHQLLAGKGGDVSAVVRAHR